MVESFEDGNSSLNLERLRDAGSKLGRIFDDLPSGTKAQSIKWTKRRERWIDKYGPSCFLSLLPKRINKNTFLLTMATHTLLREGITTIDELITANPLDIEGRRQVGPKTFEFFSALRGLAQAQAQANIKHTST